MQASCILTVPESEDEYDDEFAKWGPELMDVFEIGNPNVVWQYFGDATSGNFVQYPYGPATGYGYDPRRRPWFAASASGPKDVVVVVDVTDYTNSAFLTEVVGTLLSRLSGDDYVNVVAKHQSQLKSPCFGEHLARATEKNKAEIMRFVEDLGALSYSDLPGAFDLGIRAAGATRDKLAGSMCETNVIVITDRTAVDEGDVQKMKNSILRLAEDNNDGSETCLSCKSRPIARLQTTTYSTA